MLFGPQFGLPGGLNLRPPNTNPPSQGYPGNNDHMDYATFVSQEPATKAVTGPPLANPHRRPKRPVSKAPGTFSSPRRQLGAHKSEDHHTASMESLHTASTNIEDHTASLKSLHNASASDSDAEPYVPTLLSQAQTTQKRSASTSKKVEESKAAERSPDSKKPPEPVATSRSQQRSERKKKLSESPGAAPESITLKNHQAAMQKMKDDMKSVKDAYDKQLMQERKAAIEREDALKAEHALVIDKMKKQYHAQLSKQRGQGQDKLQEVQQTFTDIKQDQSARANNDNEVEGYKSRILDQQREIEQMKSLQKLHAAERQAEVNSLKMQLRQYGASVPTTPPEDSNPGLESAAAKPIRRSMSKELKEGDVTRAEIAANVGRGADAKYAYLEQLQKQQTQMKVELDRTMLKLSAVQSDRERLLTKTAEYEEELTFFRKQLHVSTETVELEKQVRKRAEDEKQRTEEEYQQKHRQIEEEKKRTEEEYKRKFAADRGEMQEKNRRIEEEKKRTEAEKNAMLKKNKEEKQKMEEKYRLEREEKQRQIEEERARIESLQTKLDAEKSKPQKEKQQREDQTRELSLEGTPPLGLGPLSLEEQERKKVEEKNRMMKVERQRQAELQRQREVEASKQRQLEEMANEQENISCYSPSGESSESRMMSKAAIDNSAQLVNDVMTNIVDESQRPGEDVETVIQTGSSWSPQRERQQVSPSPARSVSTVERYSPSDDSENMFAAIETTIVACVQAVETEEQRLQAEADAKERYERDQEELRQRAAMDGKELEEKLLTQEAKQQEEEQASERQQQQEKEAAIKIQSTYKGKATRKEMQKQRKASREAKAKAETDVDEDGPAFHALEEKVHELEELEDGPAFHALEEKVHELEEELKPVERKFNEEEEARKKKEEEEQLTEKAIKIQAVQRGKADRKKVEEKRLEEARKKDEDYERRMKQHLEESRQKEEEYKQRVEAKNEELKKHINDRDIDLATIDSQQVQLNNKDAEWSQRLHKKMAELEDERKKREVEFKKLKGSLSDEWMQRLESNEDQWAQLVTTQEERFVEASADFEQRLAHKDAECSKKEHEWSKRLNDLKAERTLLTKKLKQVSQSIKHEMGHERILKEQTAMQLEDHRSRLTVLLEENHYKSEELRSLRSMAMVSSTQTAEVWRVANEAMETQRTKMEMEAKEKIEATQRAYEDNAEDKTFRSQLHLQRQVYELEEEATDHKKLIKSLLEEQADTLLREHQAMERLAMKAEDYLSKAWEYSAYKEYCTSETQIARAVLDQLWIKSAKDDQLLEWKKIQAEKNQMGDVMTQLTAVVAKKREQMAKQEQAMQTIQAELAAREEEITKLKVFSLQPQTLTIPASNKGGKHPDKKEPDLKKTMRDFLQELLKGKKMKLVMEGGGTMPSTLSIAKDLSALTLETAGTKYAIPMAEVQHVIAGKEVPPGVWTSTPIDENSITILFGPSVDESHTCCFRADSIEERDKFCNSMKVLRLSNVKQ